MEGIMTEEEYHRIARREKIFYAVLIIAWCFAFVVWFTIGFPKAKWVLIGGGTLIYLYLKSTFTGLPWSRRLVKPDPVRMEVQEEIGTEEDYPLISETERKGYTTLAELCLAEETQKKLASFFETLKDYSGAGEDGEYGSTLFYVMEYMDEEAHIFFLMGLDWKQEVETLEWRIESALTKNFGVSADLPDFRTYGNKSISAPSVFADYDNALRRKGFQLGFIDVECDEYVIFVHRTADRDKAADAVHRIGYRYKEVADLAI